MTTQTDFPYPRIITFVSSTAFQIIFTLLTLGLVIFYNAAYYWFVPVTGVWLDYQDQNRNSTLIAGLDSSSPGELAGLQLGDHILSINGHPITTLNTPIHLLTNGDDTETYIVQRGSQTLKILVKTGNYFQYPSYLADIVPVQLLSLLFYFLGITMLLFSPLKDIRGRLLAVVWALAGLAIAATGPGYISCAWFAPNVALLTFAVSIFFSVSAHLYFPILSFNNHQRTTALYGLAGLTVTLILAYGLQQLYFAFHKINPSVSISETIINLAFYLSWMFNIGLLLKNRFFVKDSESRRQIGIIFWGTVIGFLPFLLLYGFPALIFGRGSQFILLPSNVLILPLVFVPITYAYVINQRKLIKIDLLINRALVLLLLILVILFVSWMILGLLSIYLSLPSEIAVAGSLLCVLVALPSAGLRQHIQIQVDRVLYGGYYDFTTVTSDLSNRLVQTMDRPAFIQLITNELPGMMKINQRALLLFSNNYLTLQYPETGTFSAPICDEVCDILRAAKGPVRAQNLWNLLPPTGIQDWQMFSWARLFVPIIHSGTLHGLLILGERSTGDIYSNQDLQIIGTVAQQAALSIANIILVEELRGLARKMVRQDEEQRKKVARDLHDSVLQNLFFIKQRLARTDPDSVEFVDDTIDSLRQTIKAQRPSLLDRALTIALQDLIADMKKLDTRGLEFHWYSTVPDSIRLSDEQATSIYRIAQEALFNVMKHANAGTVDVSARFEDGILEIEIEDDGIGMNVPGGIQGGPHYGLAGMKERALMIGAELKLESEPGNGMRVSVNLKL